MEKDEDNENQCKNRNCERKKKERKKLTKQWICKESGNGTREEVKKTRIKLRRETGE